MNFEDIDDKMTSVIELLSELDNLIDTVGITYDVKNKKAHKIIERLRIWYEERY